MKTSKFNLYKNHKHGIGVWSIWVDGNTIYIEHRTSLHSSPVLHTEVVKEGKASRTLRQQILSRVKSRINKQRDKGYVDTIEEASAPPTNALNFSQPMLATPLKRARMEDTMYIQHKFDGHRCLITKREGRLIPYSRQGKVIDTIAHITNEIDIDSLEEGMTLDGELYIHGVRLQTIASWVKRLQPETLSLDYYIYDIIMPGTYSQRLDYLQNLEFQGVSCRIAETRHVNLSRFNITDQLSQSIQEGYEGLIARKPGSTYEAGRRSTSLIKIKAMEDDEFKVVDITPSADGWGVLTMELPGGNTFRASAPGTVEDKVYVLNNKDEFIGRMVTVEYSQLTKDKVPFHPVATRWREDI